MQYSLGLFKPKRPWAKSYLKEAEVKQILSSLIQLSDGEQTHPLPQTRSLL